MLNNVITLMTRDVIQPMSPTMSHNRKRNVKRTSGRIVLLNMNRLPSMRQLISAELLLLRNVINQDLRYAELIMSLSVGLSRRFMRLRMMLLTVKLRLKRNVRKKLLAILPAPNVLNGPRKFALFPRSLSRSTPPSLDVPRSP